MAVLLRCNFWHKIRHSSGNQNKTQCVNMFTLERKWAYFSKFTVYNAFLDRFEYIFHGHHPHSYLYCCRLWMNVGFVCENICKKISLVKMSTNGKKVLWDPNKLQGTSAFLAKINTFRLSRLPPSASAFNSITIFNRDDRSIVYLQLLLDPC